MMGIGFDKKKASGVSRSIGCDRPRLGIVFKHFPVGSPGTMAIILSCCSFLFLWLDTSSFPGPMTRQKEEIHVTREAHL